MFKKLIRIIDERRKRKYLTIFPYRYTDIDGRKWFNATYRTSYNQLRKLI